MVPVSIAVPVEQGKELAARHDFMEEKARASSSHCELRPLR